MSKRLDPDAQACLLGSLVKVLETARLGRRTMTYLEVADQLAMPGPHRIHKTARLIEVLLKRQVEHGAPPSAALVVSRTGTGRPAPGFFERARRLGLFDGADPDAFHEAMLKQLFDRVSP